MKKILTLVLALAMALSLAACGSSAPAASTPAASTPAASGSGEAAKDYSAMTIDELKGEIATVTDGKLTVATSPDFAPYEFYSIGADGTPTLSGFDMALAQYVADYLGLKLDVVPMDFDGVLMEVGMGNVDLGMAGLSPDPKRADAMDFSDIYYQGGQSLCTIQANKDKWAALTDLNDPALSIGAQTGSIQADLAMENSPDANIIQLAKVTDIISELLSGKLDAAYIETVVAQSYQVNYPDLFVAFDVPYEVAGSAIGVTKDNEALLAGVNLAIAAALADGSMDKFVAEANELAGGEIIEGLLEG